MNKITIIGFAIFFITASLWSQAPIIIDTKAIPGQYLLTVEEVDATSDSTKIITKWIPGEDVNGDAIANKYQWTVKDQVKTTTSTRQVFNPIYELDSSGDPQLITVPAIVPSVITPPFGGGDNVAGGTRYMKTYNGVRMTATLGYPAPFDGHVIYVGWSFKVVNHSVNGNATVEVMIGGVASGAKDTVTITGNADYKGVSVFTPPASFEYAKEDILSLKVTHDTGIYNTKFINAYFGTAGDGP